MLNLEGLLGSLVGGALGARPKPTTRVDKFLRGGRGSFLNAGTLLTAAALGYGAYEIWRTRNGGGGPLNATIGGMGNVMPPQSSPPSVTSTGAPLPPPLPGTRSSVEVVSTPQDGLPRVAGLLLAAARADGEMGEAEYAQILRAARENGADAHVMGALQNPRPVAALVEGVRDPGLARDLYVLAYSVVRADAKRERARARVARELAQHLRLDAANVARFEADADARIAQA